MLPLWHGSRINNQRCAIGNQWRNSTKEPTDENPISNGASENRTPPISGHFFCAIGFFHWRTKGATSCAPLMKAP
jgi:hypothetical protein